MLVIILYVLGPVVVLAYKTLDYYKFWDKLTGRFYALKGLHRLQTPTGYPKSWLYNDEIDNKEFTALCNRIRKKTRYAKIINVLNEGHEPSLITTAGEPTALKGLIENWAQEDKYYYSPGHPVLMVFGVTRDGGKKGKGEKCCSLGELEKWLENEKSARDFWLGVFVLTIFTIASIILRLQVLGKI